MAKDKLGYGASRKHTHGAKDVEKAIGITHSLHQLSTSLLSSSATSSSSSPLSSASLGGAMAAGGARPVALLKWSFDDYIVEEVMPNGVVAGAASETKANGADPTQASAGSLLLRITSEGVPDPVVERWLRQRLPHDVPFHFLTPIDFVSSSVRHVWVRAPSDRADVLALCRTAQKVHTAAGPFFLSEAIPIVVPATAKVFPLSCLPSLHYTIVLRNVVGSLSDVLLPLRHIGEHGFLNYSHIGRHGVGTGHVYGTAKHLMRREYGAVLQHHARTLAEFTTHVSRELPALLEALGDDHTARPHAGGASSSSASLMRRNAREWRDLANSVRNAAHADDEVLRRNKGPTGLYQPHHALLCDFVDRMADVAPRVGGADTAQMIREGIARRVLLEKMHTVSEVHFNAMASLSLDHVPLRLATLGSSEAPRLIPRLGDIVCTERSLLSSPSSPRATIGGLLDGFEAAADHVNGALTSEAHVDWSRAAMEEGIGEGCVSAPQRGDRQHGAFKIVESEEEAAQYTLADVVLPCFGQGCGAMRMPAPAPASSSAPASSASNPLLLPHNASAALFATLVKNLEISGLSEMKLAPLPCYRRLVVKPENYGFYVIDKQRGWDWVEGPNAEALKARLYTDLEGIPRLESPFMRLNQHKRLPARSGLRGDDARKFFLKPARKHSMMCVVQGTLPRGSPVTSLLREVFQVTTLSPSAIFQLMR